VIDRYIGLLADRQRLEATERAIGTIVRPGDVVVDIGTGTGAFALFAARAGARRVYAIESGRVVEVARAMVRANGAGDVIEVVEADATRWRPPEPVDVAIYEDFEDIGLGPALAALVDHWRPLVKPSGRFIPQHLSVRFAPAEDAKEHRRVFPWPDSRAYDLDVTPLVHLAEHVRSNATSPPDGLLAPAQTCFDYTVGNELSSSGETTVSFTASRAGRLHGIALWFDTLLAPSVTWSNAPASEPTVWGNAFLHVAEAPDVATGDRIQVRLAYAPQWSEQSWLWSWHVLVEDAAGACKHSEERSTFHAEPTSVEQLRKWSLDHPLQSDDQVQVCRRIWELVDGRRTARDIGATLAIEFPDLVPDALTVAEEVVRMVRKSRR
jgi:SAM-dependent methyltransferase